MAIITRTIHSIVIGWRMDDGDDDDDDEEEEEERTMRRSWHGRNRN